MTGLEKITAGIQGESEEAISRIRQDAAEKSAALMDEASRQAAAACAQIREETENQVHEIAERAASAAQLNRRKKMLQAKQDLIAEVLQKALEKAKSLPEGVYFDTILAMAARAAHACAGEICLNARDLARLPNGFESALNAALPAPAKLEVARQAAAIESGFVLRYDGIEENCSFESVFAAKHDEMQDRVCGILFA